MTADGISKHCIGRNISTKAVGTDDRQDITLNYKFAEGSEEERLAVFQANRFSSRKNHNIYDKKMDVDVKFKLVGSSDMDILIGEVKSKLVLLTFQQGLKGR